MQSPSSSPIPVTQGTYSKFAHTFGAGGHRFATVLAKGASGVCQYIGAPMHPALIVCFSRFSQPQSVLKDVECTDMYSGLLVRNT